MAIRNQGDISWCYAHSAADYLQFYFKVPDQISAADLAVQYNLRPWPQLLRWVRRAPVGETGFMRTVLWDAQKSGYCRESDFPSETWSKRYLTGARKGQREQVGLDKAIQDLQGLNDLAQMELYLAPTELPFVYEFKNITNAQFYDVVSRATRKSLLNDLRIAACDGHRKAYPGEVRGIAMRPKGPNAFPRINELLESRTPVNVDFFSGFLENMDSYSRKIGHLHSTVLMGRRFKKETNECQYLLKNSYGADCKGYDPRHECDGGYFWVSESGLYKAMVTYVYVKDRLADDTGPDLELK